MDGIGLGYSWDESTREGGLQKADSSIVLSWGQEEAL